MTRLMFDFWQHKKWLTKLKMLRLFGKPNIAPDEVSATIFFPLTGALDHPGLGLFLARGDRC